MPFQKYLYNHALENSLMMFKYFPRMDHINLSDFLDID